MIQMGDNYNQLISAALASAPEDSDLADYARARRLMGMLQDPRLASEDQEARDVLNMRRSQIEAELTRLQSSPEVVAAFEQARSDALQQTFGAEADTVAQEYANYILSDDFQQSLQGLSSEAVAERVQTELMQLNAMNPALQAEVSESLQQQALIRAATEALTQPGEAGDQAEAGVAAAIESFLSYSQTAASTSRHTGNALRALSGGQHSLQEIGQAIARGTRNIRLDDMNNGMAQVRDYLNTLPEGLRRSSLEALAVMEGNGTLGSLIALGSVAGIARTDVPEPGDVGAWATLVGASADLVGNSNHLLRGVSHSQRIFDAMGASSMAQFMTRVGQTADRMDAFADLTINGARAADAINNGARFAARFPVFNGIAAGAGIVADGYAAYQEYQNEDNLGMAMRGVGLASGAASLAAITVMSGPAAPITLVGATVVGLTAWGIDAMWGESDLTGQIRQDLRALGISSQEENTFRDLTTRPVTRPQRGGGTQTHRVAVSDETIRSRAQQADNAQRVALINQYMDQWTDGDEETLIYNVLMDTPTANGEFLDLIEQLDTTTLASEMENSTRAVNLLERMGQAYLEAGREPGPAFSNYLERLATDHNASAIHSFLNRAPDEIQSAVPASVRRSMAESLMAGGTSGTEERAIYRLLNTASDAQFDTLVQEGGLDFLNQLYSELSETQSQGILRRLAQSDDSATQTLGRQFFRAVAREEGQGDAAYLAAGVLSGLSDAEIQALPRSTVQAMGQTMKSYWDSTIFGDSTSRSGFERLQRLGFQFY
ncbi:MAG: hypothetical protein IGS03_16530 [Candidatus Sericytochromatia bacterium]|nr:hypothetical protein [Candidatus Sericytochromatia bacterium]